MAPAPRKSTTLPFALRRGARAAFVALLLAGDAAPRLHALHAQAAPAQPPAMPPATLPATPARASLSAADGIGTGVLVLGTLALTRLDSLIAHEARKPGPQSNGVLRGTAQGLRFLGIPGTGLAAGALYVAGRAADDPSTRDLGLRSGEALIVGSAGTQLLKWLVGRARPDTPGANGFDARFGRGFESDAFQSFPSGHTAAAFATAAAVTSELSRRGAGSRVPIGLALHGGAALVGLSRIYHNRHWASDVAAGAALGIVSGWLVVRRIE
jgi:membrane-associated phospholipid phosphatase